MPRYRFIGSVERVLFGLVHGKEGNAVLHRDGGDHGQPDESTVVARPGDEVETTEPYPHAEMVNVETGEIDEPAKPVAQGGIIPGNPITFIGEQGPELAHIPTPPAETGDEGGDDGTVVTDADAAAELTDETPADDDTTAQAPADAPAEGQE
jgi:hypothetical protein